VQRYKEPLTGLRAAPPMQLNDSFFDLPPNLRPDSSGVVVHMGSARGACSLVSDSARAPIVVHLRPIPQIYEFDHGPRPDSSDVVVHMGSARGALLAWV